MSSTLKTTLTIDDSAIVDGNTIDASDHTTPFGQVETQFRSGQLSVSAEDTHVKHLEDALTGATDRLKLTKQTASGNESLEIDLDADGITSGFVATANGSGGWSWAAAGGGGAAPVDITATAGEDLALRDYVYLDESSGTWFKVDTDATPVKCGRIRAIVNDAAITDTNTGSVRLIGEISGFSGLTAWSPVYASATPGGITQTRPSPTSGGAQVAVIQIGIATSTSSVMILPPRPVMYMLRDEIADDATLTIQHHPDVLAHTRRARAYVGSSTSGTAITEYASSNQDEDVPLRQNIIDTYTADLCTGGTAIGDMTDASGLAGGFDNDASSPAKKSSSTTGIIGYDFGAGNDKAIRQYTLQECTIEAESRMFKDWTFQYSDNNSDWTTADTQTEETGWTNGEKRTYQIANVGSHRYWRVNCSANNGTSITTIGEVEMMEATFDTKDKLSQTFTLASDADIDSVMLYLKKVGSPVGTGTVRIETVSGGDPTGTLANASASATFSESALTTSYTEQMVSFPLSFELTAGTYAIVLSTNRSGSETNYIQWGADGSSPAYAGGEMLSEESSTWASESKDAIFSVNSVGTTFVEPATIGRWSGGTRDIAVRYDDSAGADASTQTTFKNEIGATADVTAVLELP
ncbi:MAG: hypothetical protein ACFE0Q_20740 [Anaerolineae bacterium]